MKTLVEIVSLYKPVNMTLIACTLNHTKPILLGDILISSRQAMESIQLPTNRININPYLKPGKAKATDLFQKIYIINDNVAIGLAGKVTEMTAFLKEFITRCSYYNPIDEEGIKTFVKDYDLEANFADSAFFIMLMKREEERISVKLFWSPDNDVWLKKSSEVFEEVFACGTGAADFVHNASEQQTFEASTEKGDVHRAIAANFGFIAKFLAIERVTLHTVKKNWGAGFEAIIFDGHAFMKLDQIAYVTCQGKFDAEGNIGLPYPQLIQYYEYYKDVLFISSIEVREWETKEEGDKIILRAESYRADMFVVPRIDLATGSTIEIPPSYHFSTNRVALGYAILTPSNGVFAPSFFTESSDLQINYKDAEYIEVILSKRINEMISAKAKEVFPDL